MNANTIYSIGVGLLLLGTALTYWGSHLKSAEATKTLKTAISEKNAEIDNLKIQLNELQDGNKELIEGKNTLITQNQELNNKVGKYQKDLKEKEEKIKELERKTKNIDSLSNVETKIGDLVLERDGQTVNITSIDKKIEDRLIDVKNIAKKDTDKALTMIEELEQTYPDNIPEGGKILKAVYLCKKEHYKQSINILEKLDKNNISSKNRQLYFYLIGSCYAKLSDYENAKKYLALAIKMNTNKKFTAKAEKNLEIIQNIKTGIKIEKKEIIFLEKRNDIFVYKVSFQARFVNAHKNKELNLKKVDIILKNRKNGEEKVRTAFPEYTIQKNGYYLTDYVSYKIGFLEKIDELNLIIKGYFENYGAMEANVIEKIIY